jgi:hypothetical protein
MDFTIDDRSDNGRTSKSNVNGNPKGGGQECPSHTPG